MKKPLILIVAYINVDYIQIKKEEYMEEMTRKIKDEYCDEFNDVKIFTIAVINQPTKIKCIYDGK